MRKSKGFIVLMLFLCSILPVIQPANASASENYWEEMAPIQPKFLYTYGAAVVNGSIYFMGTEINEQYNPQTNTWTSKTPSPTSFAGGVAAVTACQNKIYVIGAKVHMVYDPSTDTWENRTPMPTERYTNDANVIDGKIYVISGGIPAYIGQFFASSATEVYDPENDSWTELEPIPTPVSGYASAVLDNKIYIIGGKKQGTGYVPPSNLVQIYDPKTNQWTQGTPLEEPVSGAAAITTTGLMAPKRIYVIGGDIIIAGNNYVSYSDHTQFYNPETQSWSFGAQMPTGRSSLALVNINDTLYALGGTNRTGYGITSDDQIALLRTHANERYFPVAYGTNPEIPEFPSWTPMLFVLTVLTVTLTIYKRKILKTPKHHS